MSFEPRAPTSQHMAAWTDAVVTHQWENDLNYLYYDVLYGGYPLIHNSERLKDYGYYYESFDALYGASVLGGAWLDHDRLLEDYRRKSAALFGLLSPKNRTLQETHERLLT